MTAVLVRRHHLVMDGRHRQSAERIVVAGHGGGGVPRQVVVVDSALRSVAGGDQFPGAGKLLGGVVACIPGADLGARDGVGEPLPLLVRSTSTSGMFLMREYYCTGGIFSTRPEPSPLVSSCMKNLISSVGPGGATPGFLLWSGGRQEVVQRRALTVEGFQDEFGVVLDAQVDDATDLIPVSGSVRMVTERCAGAGAGAGCGFTRPRASAIVMSGVIVPVSMCCSISSASSRESTYSASMDRGKSSEFRRFRLRPIDIR